MIARANRGLTRVTVLFLADRVNDRVRFGTPSAERIIDRRARIELYPSRPAAKSPPPASPPTGKPEARARPRPSRIL